jgi:membrane-bound lytic murein transglycosylase D
MMVAMFKMKLLWNLITVVLCFLAGESIFASPDRSLSTYTKVDSQPQFDIPVTYNLKVKNWITFFQGPGRKWYRTWLERSHRYLPSMQKVLRERSMPQDLAYVAMIESGFSSSAKSTAKAVGYWQFIESTGSRYGLKINWWIDERQDFHKSTMAASRYLGDLFRMFGSWYLTAAAFNMGEGRLKRLVQKHKSNNFWVLSKAPDFPSETREYIPKMLAAMLIAKVPKLYGFTDIVPKEPYRYEYFYVPGGTDLMNLASAVGVELTMLQTLNPELTKGFVPSSIKNHRIRIPTGYTLAVSSYIRSQL